MKIALDTNCFIDAMNQQSPSHTAMQRILIAQAARQVDIHVSLHTLHELEQKPDAALDLARGFQLLPYWPIGTIKELVGTISQATGTFDDIRRNDVIQQELESLAKAGNDIRDRGAYIDALRASMDIFVTSDTHLAGKDQAQRILDRFHMRIVRPDEAASIIGQHSL